MSFRAFQVLRAVMVSSIGSNRATLTPSGGVPLRRIMSLSPLGSFGSGDKAVDRRTTTISRRTNSTQSTGEEEEKGSRVLHLDHDSVLDGVRKRVVTVIDVRRPDEIETLGIIPTAYNIPVDDVETALQMNDKDFLRLYKFEKPMPNGPIIITYCRSGVRSERACQIFQKFNYKNIANYVGSWNDWSEKHPEDVRNNPVTDKKD